MYTFTPFYHKNKSYYDNDDIQRQYFLKIQTMCKTNATTEQIQEQLDKLANLNGMYTNNTTEYNLTYSLLQCANDKITQLEKMMPGNKFNVDIAFSTQIVTSIKSSYLLYIEKYGIPDDGIFLEELLMEFQ